MENINYFVQGSLKFYHLIESVVRSNNNFLTLDSNSTFNGLNKTIYIYDVSNYEGFIQLNGGTVKNINIIVYGNSSLASGAGWLIRKNSWGTIENVSIRGNIDNINAGGAIGENFGSSTVTSVIKRVSCYGNITGNNAGGIVGNNLCNSTDSSNTVIISECRFIGDISAINAGGIVGANAGYKGGNIYLSNCYTEPFFRVNGNGGIFGQYASRGSSNLTTESYISMNNIYVNTKSAFTGSNGVLGPNPTYFDTSSNERNGRIDISNVFFNNIHIIPLMIQTVK
jgi:hypothetical protein